MIDVNTTDRRSRLLRSGNIEQAAVAPAAGGGTANEGLNTAVPPETLPVFQEDLTVSKRAIVAGSVRVSTTTDTHEEIAEVTLDRNRVDVSRVPVGRIVEVAPRVRTEGDTTIIPVIEERFVVVKQLYLTEELHIRHHVEQEVSRTPVQLRRQTAVVERLDAEGQVVVEPVSQP